MNDGLIDARRERSLRTVGNVSYLLHTIVAVGAVMPGVQASVLLLLVAFAIDLVGDASGIDAAQRDENRVGIVDSRVRREGPHP